jgi:hypothetical protein
MYTVPSEPPMDDVKEHFFLEELRFLSDAATGHAVRIREIAKEWTQAGVEVDAINSRHPRDQSAETQNRRTELNAGRVRLQGEVFVLIDAFLALVGRMALISFPKGRIRTQRKR